MLWLDNIHQSAPVNVTTTTGNGGGNGVGNIVYQSPTSSCTPTHHRIQLQQFVIATGTYQRASGSVSRFPRAGGTSLWCISGVFDMF